MKTVCSTPLLLIAIGLAACGGSSSDPLTPSDPGIPVGDKAKMHYVQSQMKINGMRDRIALLQNSCVNLRRVQTLPSSDPITIDDVDKRVEMLVTDNYYAADRMASYTRGYQVMMNAECYLGAVIETVTFESSFADGRSIKWSRDGSDYSERVETVQDVAALKALAEAIARQGISFPVSQDDLSKIRVSTGQKLTFDGVSCNENKFPAQNMTTCTAQVSDPVPMMGLAGQDNLTLSVKIIPPGETIDSPSAVNSNATKVKLSLDIDPGLFDPKSL